MNFANKYFTSSTNPVEVCSKAVLVSFVLDLTRFWCDAAIETASSASYIKSSRQKSVQDDMAPRKVSFSLNPSNELFLVNNFAKFNYFCNSTVPSIISVNVTVPSTF